MAVSTSLVSFRGPNTADFHGSWGWWTPTKQTQEQLVSVSEDGRSLRVRTVPGLDWWRTPLRTSDDAPAFVLRLAEEHLRRDFTASVSIKGSWRQTYDQGCLFLHVVDRQNGTRWMKTGIERDHDKDWVGAVVANPYSDWSIATPADASHLSERLFRFTLTRKGHKLSITSEEGDDSPLAFRRDVNGFFADVDIAEIRVGVMACQPNKDNAGVNVEFSDFNFGFS